MKVSVAWVALRRKVARRDEADEEEGDEGGEEEEEESDDNEEDEEKDEEDIDEHGEEEEGHEEEEEKEEDTGDEDGEDDDNQVSTKSNSMVVQVATEPVAVPPIKRIHEDWAEWEVYKKRYARRTHQVISVEVAVPVEKRNKRIAGLATRLPDVPTELGTFERTYICTHGSKPRNRSGKGKGKNQGKVKRRLFRHIRFTGCPFRFRVQAFPCKDGKWRLQVHVTCQWHNHLVGPKVYGTYPVARGIKSNESKKRAGEMAADGAKPDQIYDMLLDRGENVYKRDVENFVQAHESRVARRDDDAATARLLAKLADDDPDAVITVDQTHHGETGVISVSISTKHQRGMNIRFGELLLLDCTHKTNRYNYQLCTAMVMDEFGSGEVVQQSLLETNADWHMERVCKHLKRSNPEAWKLIRVVMVDKDLNEIKVLEREFPEARILICHFTSSNTCRPTCTSRSLASCPRTTTTLSRVHRLVYAESQDEFETDKAAFVATCKRLNFMAFVAYMERNWFSCIDMWALHRRLKISHLKNHTNNRLENWFGKFKQGVDENSSMVDCVQALINEVRRCEREYEFANIRPGRYYNEHYDEEMANVLLCSTPYVAKILEVQYVMALNKHEVYGFAVNDADKTVSVQGNRHTRTVSLIDYSCDCEFALGMRLPCRHSMAYRKHQKMSVIPLKKIDVRWKRHACAPRPVQPVVINKAPSRETPSEPFLHDRRNRYNEAMRLLQPICSELADIDDESEFKAHIAFLQASFRNVRKRKRVAGEDDQDERVKRVAVKANDEDVDMPPTQRANEEADLPPTQRTSEEAHLSPAPHDHDTSLELSQANSLWSEEVGVVPAPQLEHLPLVLSTPVDLVVGTGSDLVSLGQDLVDIVFNALLARGEQRSSSLIDLGGA